MSAPKRQHYLPESYLESFTKNGFLWVYDRTQNRFRREQPKNTAVRNHYYSLRDEHGNKDPHIEKALSILEGRAKLVIQKLEREDRITPEDRVNLGLHLGVLYCRGPQYQRAVNEIISGHFRYLLLRNLNDPIASKHFTEPEKQLEYVASDRFKLQLSRNATIVQMLRQGREIGRAFFISDWIVARSDPSAAFVTCDVPFGLLTDPGYTQPVGVVSPEAITAVPLSPKTCLLMVGDQARFARTTLSPDEVRDINLAVLRETEDYAIGRDEMQLRELARVAKLDDPRRRSKMVVKEFPDPGGDPMKSIAVTYRANS